MRRTKKPAFTAGFLLLTLSLLAPVLLSLASCSAMAPYLAFQQDWSYTFDDKGIPFASSDALRHWVSSAIIYTSDQAAWGHDEYWASPEQTFDAGIGDCDDKAILYMYFAYTRGFSRDLEFVGIMPSSGIGHALVRQGELYEDPTNNLLFPLGSMTSTVLYRLNFGQVMFIATHDHAQARGGVPLGLSLTANAILAGKAVQGESWKWESCFRPPHKNHAPYRREPATLPGTLDHHG
jgi:hypothetical protein